MTDQQFAWITGSLNTIAERLDRHIQDSQEYREVVAVLQSRMILLDKVDKRVASLERNWAKVIGFAAGGGFLGAGGMAALWRLLNLD